MFKAKAKPKKRSKGIDTQGRIDVVELKLEGLKNTQIAERANISYQVVGNALFQALVLGWKSYRNTCSGGFPGVVAVRQADQVDFLLRDALKEYRLKLRKEKLVAPNEKVILEAAPAKPSRNPFSVVASWFTRRAA